MFVCRYSESKNHLAYLMKMELLFTLSNASNLNEFFEFLFDFINCLFFGFLSSGSPSSNIYAFSNCFHENFLNGGPIIIIIIKPASVFLINSKISENLMCFPKLFEILSSIFAYSMKILFPSPSPSPYHFTIYRGGWGGERGSGRRGKK